MCKKLWTLLWAERSQTYWTNVTMAYLVLITFFICFAIFINLFG